MVILNHDGVVRFGNNGAVENGSNHDSFRNTSKLKRTYWVQRRGAENSERGRDVGICKGWEAVVWTGSVAKQDFYRQFGE